MKLILIRHGRTEANEQKLYCGSTDLPLSEAGMAELRQKAPLSLPSGLRILTSGMRRCEQTLEILCGDVPHQSDSAFREMDFGVFEMQSYAQLKDNPAYAAWISGDNESNVTPGGESGNLMTERVLAGFSHLLADNQDTLLVTHGGVIAALMAHLFPDEEKNRYEWQPKPGCGYILDTDKNEYFPV